MVPFSALAVSTSAAGVRPGRREHRVVDLDRQDLRAVGNPQRDGDAVLLSECVESRHGGDLFRGVMWLLVGQQGS